MKLQFVFAAALALALVGCFGPSREQIAMQDGSNCTGMGFKEARQSTRNAAWQCCNVATMPTPHTARMYPQRCKTSITRCRTTALITPPITIRHLFATATGHLPSNPWHRQSGGVRMKNAIAYRRLSKKRKGGSPLGGALRSLPHAGCSAFFAVIHWGQEGECKSSILSYKPII